MLSLTLRIQTPNLSIPNPLTLQIGGELLFMPEDASSWMNSLKIYGSHLSIHTKDSASTIQQNAELAGNPILLEPANSSTNRQPITNRPGMRMEYSVQQSQAGKPEWLEPPQIPQYILELLKFWISRMENTSGISGIAKGQSPPGR